MNKFCRLLRRCPPFTLSALGFYKIINATSKINEEPATVELKQSMAEQLTHKYLFQQTCTLSVNSSCQMIAIALVALWDASNKYKNELEQLIEIMQNDSVVDDGLDDLLVEYRSKVSEAKTFYLDSVSAMESALKLGQSSGQMSFVVEANTAFNIMSEKFHSAEKEFQSCIENTRKIEEKFNKVLADIVEKSKNQT